MRIDALYHWSPTKNRIDILKHGLNLYADSISHPGFAYPYICCATTPQDGWNLSGDTHWGEEEDEWDLWQVWIDPDDNFTIRSDLGTRLREIRLHNHIPPTRLWLVGTKTALSAVEVSALPASQRAPHRARARRKAKK